VVRNLLGFLLCFMSFTSWSQIVTYDTIVEIKEVDIGIFDTIMYVKKHVEIKEKVVVVDTVRGDQWAFGSYGGIPLLSSKALYIAPDLTFNSSETKGYYFGASLYYNFSKKWAVRIGAKFDYQKIGANYTKSANYTVDVFEEVDDTLDTYYNVSGNDTNYFHIIEPKTIESTEEKTSYSDLTYSWELYFLKIPIQASYALELNRWNFSFLAGTSLNFQLQNLTSNPTVEQESVVSFYPSGIVSLQAGYFVGNSTVIHVEPLLEKSFISSKKSVIPSSQFSFGMGLKQFF
jgi:hypothetical protein